MTMPDDLTEAMRAALEQFGDDWTLFPTDGPKLQAAFDAGLFEATSGILHGRMRLWVRRTEAGRSILAKGLGK